MQTPGRTLGRTGLRVHPLGVAGNYGIDADGIERGFHELGTNYFFATTRMQPMVRAVKSIVATGHRDRLVLGTGFNVPFGFRVRPALESALKTFGVDCIDVFHLFWVQGHWYVTGNTWKEMRKLKEEGLVKSLAISCHDRPLARKLVTELDLDVLMLRYNAAHRGAEKEVFDSLPNDAAKRPGIISYTATRWGKLLERAGDEGPMTAAECYRFAAGHPSVDVVLCGARSYEELRDDARAIEQGPLPEARLAEIRRFGDRVRASATGKLGFLGG
jgi:aryl-alcohol dehydrogenase-like predicted oxidoreductase